MNNRTDIEHSATNQSTFPSADTSSVSPNRYLNRDLSWIEFNRRVLEESQDVTAPLLERVKFLSIVSSNLDEFMAVRVAGIKDQIKAGYVKKDFTGITPIELLKRIMRRTSSMVADQYKTHRELARQLVKENLCFTTYRDLNNSQKKVMDEYFHDIVFPVLTPMAVDQSRPFPLVHSLGVYLAVVLKRDGEEEEEGEEPYFAIVQVPSILSRTVEIPARTNSKKKEFILLEQLIQRHIHTLFSGYTPVSVHGFRITRNADLTLNEEGAEDLLEEIEKELRKRRWGLPVRMEVEKGMHPYALELLMDEFEIQDNSIFTIDGPLDLTYLMKFALQLQPAYPALGYPRLEPDYPREFAGVDDLFAVLRQQDVLVHHPYESFEVVNELIDQAAHDPKVLAIKMTLYRVSGNSEIVSALASAAEAGKQVTVVVELKARFDEERNIAWARKLEQAGCHVVYGLVGLKTHAKILLIVRQEQSYLRRYVHVSTGNYNDNTARLYTDIGLFTSHPIIGEDASALFNEITGYSATHKWQAFAVAPTDMHHKLYKLIQREAAHAAAGRPARIIAKMNSLSNRDMVDALYAASRAGVQIDLIVRGICCLSPGVEGMSEHIRVISIVDRFLEHSRIMYFENGGEEEVYLSSADWMSRNLTRRIELLCPVFDAKARRSLIEILQLNLKDNVKARRLLTTGKYARVENVLPAFRSQFEAIHIHQWKYSNRPLA